MKHSASQNPSLELRAKADEAMQNHDPGAAEAAYRATLAIDPHDIYALIGLGMAARLAGDRDAALQHFYEAAAIWPAHPWPLLEISAELNAMNRLDDAEAALREALQHSPDHHYALLGLGSLLRQCGRRAEAEEFLHRAVAADPAQGTAHAELGQLLAELGRAEDALASFDKAQAAGVENAITLPARADLLRAAGRHEEALACAQAALAAAPEDNALKFAVAAEALRLGRHADALAAYQSITGDATLSPAQRCDAALAASRIAQDQQDRATAASLLEQAIQLDTTQVQARRDLADIYRSSQSFREAETLYLDVLQANPTDLAAMGGLAIVRRQLGRHEDALTVLQQAAAIDPGNDWIQYELGITLREMGRSGDASAILEAIGSDSSMFFWSRMMLGYIARATGAHALALTCFEQAADATSDPTDALYEMVSEKRALGDMAGAAAVVAQMLARDPDGYRSHMADALLKRASGDSAGARAAFAQAAALAPAEPQPHVERAFEERLLGDLPAALAAIDDALKIDPGHEDALLKKALFLTDSGDMAGALAIYAQLRAARPGSAWAYLEAAQLYSEQGEVDAARGMLAAARKACARSPEIDLRAARLLQRHGFVDEAFTLLTLTHARYPQEFNPWFARLNAVIDLGMFDLADALLSAPPVMSVQNRARMLTAQAQLDKMRWALEAAITGFDAALAIAPKDPLALTERIKVKLISFDLTGARLDIETYAALHTASVQRKGRPANPSQSHAGQLHEEFVLDRQLTPELLSAAALPAAEQVPKFVDLVNQFPDSTAPAMGLMIALRRSGQLDPRPAPPAAAPRIPRLITQFWNDAVPPPDISALMASWAAAEPDFRIEIFDDAKALAYLRDHISPVAAQAFCRAPEPTQRGDLFRLARLFREGGYYVDADDRARGGLSAHAPQGTAFFAYQEELGSIGNNILGTIPRHPVIALALREAVTALARGDRDIVWLSTGPGLLTRAFASWLAAEPAALETRLASATFFTLTEMRRVSAMYCHAAYKTTNRAWLNAAFAKRKAVIATT